MPIEIFGLHPHPILELLAYSAGFQLYLRTRHRWNHPTLPREQMLVVVAGCIVGALVGSKVLSWIDAPLLYWSHRGDFLTLFSGKTIVGGLLGGWLGVELAKKWLGITHATGDAYVFPLVVGMIIGRVGCFMSGLDDATYGTPTGLPWGVDFGDGIARHPAQLYEIAALLVIAAVIAIRMRRPYVNGELFRIFIAAYLLFRFLVEFIKPGEHVYLGLNGIQLAALAGIGICVRQLMTQRYLPWQIAPTSSTS